jgi:hypothetical protein
VPVAIGPGLRAIGSETEVLLAAQPRLEPTRSGTVELVWPSS